MWAAIRHTYWDWVSMLMLMLLELMIYFVIVFRMLLPIYFTFFHTRKVSERDPLRPLPKDVCLYYPRRNHV